MALQQLVSPFGKVSCINLLFFALLLFSFSFAVNCKEAFASCRLCLLVLVFTNNKQSYKVSVFWSLLTLTDPVQIWQSDTASVLHEAMGYIRFLHDQVQVYTCIPSLTLSFSFSFSFTLFLSH